MYVFLDIDGVLATEDTWDEWFADGSPEAAKHELLDPECVRMVQRLCDQLDASVVISSSWRQLHPLDALVRILERGGLSVKVIGATPVRYDFDRGREIADWMAANNVGPNQILILEDAEDVDPFEHRTVRPRFRGAEAGFREAHYAEALRLVGEASPPG